MKSEWGALILAAGKGTRMKSATAKVMQPILCEPMLFYPLRTLSECEGVSIGVVVGYGKQEVSDYLTKEWPQVAIIEQKEQKGTGDAVKAGFHFWKDYKYMLVLPGDVPLITSESIKQLMRIHLLSDSSLSFISFKVADPAGYGRVIRSDCGIRIVEEKDATEDQLAINEVNSGIYAFSTAALERYINELRCKNVQGEYYLTDLVELFQQYKERVEVLSMDGEDEFLGVNDPLQLAYATNLLRDLLVKRWMEKGVKCADPETVRIGPRVDFEGEAYLAPYVQIFGETSVGDRCSIGSFAILKDSKLESGVSVHPHVVIESSVVRQNAIVGPFAYLRDETEIGPKSFAGKFVEIKHSKIGSGSKVPHLSYIGDATIGEDTNIGAGTITCNYDGKRKHPTKIGNRCFIGSDTMLVAPVELDDDATTGAGSVITQNVPMGALALARARQRNILGWKKRRENINNNDNGGRS